MKSVSFSSYGDYSSSNYGAHCLVVSLGDLDIYFSYKTPVAFRAPGKMIRVSENLWGPTTGRHLNWINSDKKERMKRNEFESELAAVLKKHKLLL